MLEAREARLTPVHEEVLRAATGNEAYYMIDADPLVVKRITAQIEDGSPMTRLYDMDVLHADGSKMDRAAPGLPERKCLICGRPAKECARRQMAPRSATSTVSGVLVADFNISDIVMNSIPVHHCYYSPVLLQIRYIAYFLPNLYQPTPSAG